MDDPDPRVHKGPLPDAGRNVWKKVMDQTFQPSSEALPTRYERNLEAAPTAKPAGAPVRSVYEIRQISHELDSQDSGAER